MKKTLVKNASPQKARQKYMVSKQCKMQPAQSQVQNTKFALSQKYMIEAKKQSKMQSRQTFKFLVQNTRAGLFINQCKIHIKFSLVQNTRNKIKISQKYKKILWCKKHSTSYPGKNTLFQVSVKSTLPNCQSKVMPFTLLVQSHALYTNSLKYVVKNEPSQFKQTCNFAFFKKSSLLMEPRPA